MGLSSLRVRQKGLDMHACTPCRQVLSDAAVLKRQAHEIEELRRVLAANGGGCGTAPHPCLVESLTPSNLRT